MCFTKKSINVLNQDNDIQKNKDTQINKDMDSNIEILNIPNKKIYFIVYDSDGISRNNSLVSRNNSLASTGYIKTSIINNFNWDNCDNKYSYSSKRKKSRYMYYE